jgi:hypothetical protein|tara:strand:- start:144 stop:527 length:384 start_codon:yes stop_codon:yes gene_type:complete
MSEIITLDLLQNLNAEDWMAIAAVFSIFISAIATLIFSRISVKHIEQEMVKEGIEPPVWDKGIGGRIIMYAMVIVANKAAKTSPVEDEAILRHARKKDYILSMFLIISSLLFFSVLAVFSIFFSSGS